MSPRKLLRIVLYVVALALLLPRAAERWGHQSNLSLFGSFWLAAILVLVIFLLMGVFRKRRLPRDEVPKRPLGLDS
jgi:hypothetical protein